MLGLLKIVDGFVIAFERLQREGSSEVCVRILGILADHHVEVFYGLSKEGRIEQS